MSGSQSSGRTDGGTSARVFGTLLEWMNDKTSPVFIVATANDIKALPPEMLRKGRFDEMFFTDLPSHAERKEIWRVQVQRYGRNPDSFDMTALADATVDFTGAEIEATMQEALYAAFADGMREPTTNDIIDAGCSSKPLAVTMSERVKELREWADGRCRMASDAPPGPEREEQARSVLR